MLRKISTKVSQAAKKRRPATKAKNNSGAKNASADDFFLPNFCNARSLASIASMCLLVALVVGLIGWQRSPDPLIELLVTIIFLLWIALAVAAALCVSRTWLSALRRRWAMLVTYILVLGVTVIISSIAWAIAETMGVFVLFDNPISITSRTGELSRNTFILNNLGIAIIVTTIGLRYLYVMHQWQQRIRSEADSKMQALISRIRPHFLFNTMNTIASLTRSEPEAAETAIEDLADLLRVTMHQNNRWVSLAEELDTCRTYIRVEALRMGERLKVEWDVDQKAKKHSVPTLCLQPLIENAIKHGIERVNNGDPIQISIEYVENGLPKLPKATLNATKHSFTKDLLKITIQNPFDPEAISVSPSGESLALDNIRQRISLSYSNNALFDFKSMHNLFTVVVQLPVLDE